MTLNLLGLVTAATTFLGVWWGHVAVRAVERRSELLWIPAVTALLLGAACEAGALLGANLYVSAALGIVGMTLVWDGLEFVRQDRRVRAGHAPANPHNARHARWLSEGRATTEDRLR